MARSDWASHDRYLGENEPYLREKLRLLGTLAIEEFFKKQPYSELDNDQTRRISGVEPAVGRCTRFTLRKAKTNLRQHFSIVGVAEQFDEALVLLSRTLGWTSQLLSIIQRMLTLKGRRLPRCRRIPLMQ